ncbi:hypothetical protein [Bradyrhizobium viridifuturi]|uniref:hypothetical protein n=1 Tax=Bradyrhizobium viridifuturi TaxID=1654716 RepID=UPI000FE13D71|nr:hypothetical protein [Bradyrhizobium viridifuturi]
MNSQISNQTLSTNGGNGRKPLEGHVEIPVEIWRPVSRLSPEDRLDRRTVNEAVANHKEPEGD